MVVQDANFVRGWLYAQKDLPKPLMEAINSVCDFVHDFSEAQLHEQTLRNNPPIVTTSDEIRETARMLSVKMAKHGTNDCIYCRQPILGYGGEVKAHPACAAKAAKENPSYVAHVITGDKNAGIAHCSVCGSDSCLLHDMSKPKPNTVTYDFSGDGKPIAEARGADRVEEQVITESPHEQIAKGRTPEQRAEISRKMKASWERRKAGADHTVEASIQGKNVVELKATPVPVRMSVVSTYIGKREDGILVESDFGDIRERLAKGDSWKLIASDYDCPVDVMTDWYDKMALLVEV